MQSPARGLGIRSLALGLLLVGYPCLASSTVLLRRDGAAHHSGMEETRAHRRAAGRGPAQQTTAPEHSDERSAASLRASTVPARSGPHRIPLPANDVHGAFWRLFVELLGPGDPCPATMRALFSRRAMEHGGADHLLAMWRRAMAPALERLATSGMAPEAVLDRALAALHIEVQAVSPWGWRLRPQLGSSATAPRAVLPDLFMVHENGAFRLLATSSMLAPMGAQALHLIRRGDLEGAGVWLDWARAHVRGARTSAADARAPTAGAAGAIAAFFALWPEHGPRDQPAMIRAAASLVAAGAQPRHAIPMLLRACAARRMDKTDNPARACRTALVAARRGSQE